MKKVLTELSSNRLMQLSQFLKVPIIYFFEDYKEFKDIDPERRYK